MSAHQAIFPVAAMARVLGVSVSGFHAWRCRPPSVHAITDTSLAFGKRCREAGVRPSMGSVGDAYDNAMRESVLAPLQCELLERRSLASQAAATKACFTLV